MANQSLVREFSDKGFLFLEDFFSKDEVEVLKQNAELMLSTDNEKRILDKNGSVRSYFAPHEENEIFDRVGRLPRLVTLVKELLGSDTYIHQTKINTKQAFVSDSWEWHQDYPYWHFEDGMPTPRVLTAMIYLDDVNEFNGPLLLIPGSHKAGLVDTNPNQITPKSADTWYKDYLESQSYMSNLTSDLKYTVKKQTLAKWIHNNSIFSAKGNAGSVLFFNGLVFHASGNNISPWERCTYLITYNSTENKLVEKVNPRPTFLASTNYSALVELTDDTLVPSQQESQAV